MSKTFVIIINLYEDIVDPFLGHKKKELIFRFLPQKLYILYIYIYRVEAEPYDPKYIFNLYFSNWGSQKNINIILERSFQQDNIDNIVLGNLSDFIFYILGIFLIQLAEWKIPMLIIHEVAYPSCSYSSAKNIKYKYKLVP